MVDGHRACRPTNRAAAGLDNFSHMVELESGALFTEGQTSRLLIIVHPDQVASLNLVRRDQVRERLNQIPFDRPLQVTGAILVYGELIRSCGEWSLVQPSTVLAPPVRIETYWWDISVNNRFRHASFRPRMCSMAIIVMLKIEQLHFQIGLWSRIACDRGTHAESYRSVALRRDAKAARKEQP